MGSHSFNHYLCGDDSQICVSKPVSPSSLQAHGFSCTLDISTWESCWAATRDAFYTLDFLIHTCPLIRVPVSLNDVIIFPDAQNWGLKVSFLKFIQFMVFSRIKLAAYIDDTFFLFYLFLLENNYFTTSW